MKRIFFFSFLLISVISFPALAAEQQVATATREKFFNTVKLYKSIQHNDFPGVVEVLTSPHRPDLNAKLPQYGRRTPLEYALRQMLKEKNIQDLEDTCKGNGIAIPLSFLLTSSTALTLWLTGDASAWPKLHNALPWISILTVLIGKQLEGQLNQGVIYKIPIIRMLLTCPDLDLSKTNLNLNNPELKNLLTKIRNQAWTLAEIQEISSLLKKSNLNITSEIL